jgi:L-lactate dehydrogenase
MRHAKIAIVGAGAVGSASAYAIMWKNIAAEIILVDLNEKKCRGEILDLSDAIPFSCTSCLRQGTLEDAGHADIIIIAAGARQKPGQPREELLKTNWEIVSSILKAMQPINKQAIIIMVSNPVDLMAYCAQQFAGLPKEQVFGTGTMLDTQRLRGIISKHVAVAEQSIQAYVLGAHGAVQFATWSCASIAGIPALQYPGMKPDLLEKMMNETTQRVYEIIECKDATYYGIAACVADICECIIFNKRRALPLSNFIPEFGVSLSLPVVLSERGIETIVPIPLTDHERRELKKAADYLKSLTQTQAVK